MRLPAFIFALLMLSPVVATAQGLEFTSPADGTEYSLTANVAFTGQGGVAGAWYTVRVFKGGSVRQEIAVQAGADGSFGGTLNAPNGGWAGGNADLELLEGTVKKDSVDISFFTNPHEGGGIPTGPT